MSHGGIHRRKVYRKNRRTTRRNANTTQVAGARKSRGRTSKGRGVFSKIYSPISHLLQATRDSFGIVTDTTRKVVREGLNGTNRIGRTVTSHANSAVRNILGRKRSNRRN